VERFGLWSGIPLKDPGNVERSVFETQVRGGWPVERSGQLSGISVMDPGNVGRSVFETQVRGGWPVERCGQWSGIDPGKVEAIRGRSSEEVGHSVGISVMDLA
jgi:hypothetical protein